MVAFAFPPRVVEREGGKEGGRVDEERGDGNEGKEIIRKTEKV